MEKKTMSVMEMGRILGLKKTESYWLMHKKLFDTVEVHGKFRIVKESFERWYANQVKYQKINGEEPGTELVKSSYSVRDLSRMLGINEAWLYEIIKSIGLKTVLIDGRKRIPKKEFEEWYASQSRYRIREDRERDREIEENTMTLPEMGRMLGIGRQQAYCLAASYKDMLEIIVVADRKRVTKESFERWYASQDKYVKLSERPKDEQRRILAALLPSKYAHAEPEVTEKPAEPHVYPDKLLFSVRESALLLRLNEKAVYRMIRSGEIEAIRHGHSIKITRDEITWQRSRLKYDTEDEGDIRWRA